MSGAGEDAAAACCGLCCLCGTGALGTWCNMNAFGGRGGRSLNTGCCGSCCNKSFNEDSMDRWEQDAKNLREQPAPTEPMAIPHEKPPASEPSTKPIGGSADA